MISIAFLSIALSLAFRHVIMMPRKNYKDDIKRFNTDKRLAQTKLDRVKNLKIDPQKAALNAINLLAYNVDSKHLVQSILIMAIENEFNSDKYIFSSWFSAFEIRAGDKDNLFYMELVDSEDLQSRGMFYSYAIHWYKRHWSDDEEIIYKKTISHPITEYTFYSKNEIHNSDSENSKPKVPISITFPNALLEFGTYSAYRFRVSAIYSERGDQVPNFRKDYFSIKIRK